MRVTEALSFREYDADPRFQRKKPYRRGSRKQSCGDNIYFRNAADTGWEQRDSFHSNSDGTANPKHITRDTGTDRVLVSDDYVYSGGDGPPFPQALRNVCKSGIGQSCCSDPELIDRFVEWVRSMNAGYQAAPFEWRSLRG